MNDKTTSSKNQQNTAQEKTAVKNQSTSQTAVKKQSTPQKAQSQAGSVKAESIVKKPSEQQKTANVKATSKEATVQQKTAANDKTAAVKKTTAEVKVAPVSKETGPQPKSKIQNQGSVKMSQNQEEDKAKKKETDTYDEQKDIQTNKGMAALAYLLFFLPLVTEPAKTSRFARFHANQSLVYWIFYIGIIVVTRIISIIFWNTVPWGVCIAFDIIFWLLYVAYVALGVWCAVRAYQGKRKKIPLIGKITIIKEEAKTVNNN